MNDFLKNLRSSQKAGKPDHRRGLDSNYFQKEDRRKRGDRRSSQYAGMEKGRTQFKDTAPEIKEQTLRIANSLERIADQNELLTEAKARQLEAMTSFFNHLNKILGEDLLSGTDAASRPSGYTVSGNYTKKDILDIIKTMRDDGSTFAMIAQYLTDKGIPTFSGRGEWHAQTIHRLCK